MSAHSQWTRRAAIIVATAAIFSRTTSWVASGMVIRIRRSRWHCPGSWVAWVGSAATVLHSGASHAICVSSVPETTRDMRLVICCWGLVSRFRVGRTEGWSPAPTTVISRYRYRNGEGLG